MDVSSDKELFLEAGTNEMELLVFRLGDTTFGINVAKVCEIIVRTDTVKLPYALDSIEGSFKLRDEVMTLINIGAYFGMEGEATKSGQGVIIIVDFMSIRCGILVDQVEHIHRLRWDEIAQPSSYLMDFNIALTGMSIVDDRIILIIDFENILLELLGLSDTLFGSSDGNQKFEDGNDIRILFSDDSPSFRKIIITALKKNGLNKITTCGDGQEAWDHLQEKPNDFDLVITDIEMPRMDGLRLTKNIKDDDALNHIPVIIISSIVGTDNMMNSRSVGSDVQVNKSDIKGLLEAIERCLPSKVMLGQN